MKLLTIIMVFFLGFLSSLIYPTNAQIPFLGVDELISPYDRIKSSQIHALNGRVVIDARDIELTSYADTNSMDPLIDKGATGLEIKPKSVEDIYIGDVAAYEATWTSGLIVHRIIDIKEDSEGKYFIFKGDNNKVEDPEKIRFSQIKYILVGVIY